MNHSALISEEKVKTPLLIIDPLGEIGKILTDRIKNDYHVVFVSKQEFEQSKDVDNILLKYHESYIPDVAYSVMIFIYHGDLRMLDMMPAITKKASEKNAKLIIVNTTSRLANVESKTVRVYLGDVVGSVDEIVITSEINKFLIHAALRKKIKLQGSGMHILHPVNIDDVIDQLLLLINSPRTTGDFMLSPQIGTTELSVAHSITKQDPEVGIDFYSDKLIPLPRAQRGEFLLPKTYDGQEAVKKAYKDIKKVLSTPKLKTFFLKKVKQQLHEKKMQKKVSTRIYLVRQLFLFLLYFLLLPPLVAFMLALFGIGTLLHAKDEFSKGNTNVQLDLKIATNSFAYAEKFLAITEDTLSLFGENLIVTPYKNQLEIAQVIGNALEKTQLLFPSSRKMSQTQFTDALLSLSRGLDTIEMLEVEGIISPQMIQPLIQNAPLVNLFKLTRDNIPQLVGYSGEKDYLVLFQNNTELRPTGGFIGSYAILSMDSGKLKNIVVHNVYDADGQLHQHVEPPWQLRRYIPIQHLFLRDINFDLDFPTSAQKASVFLQTETGQHVEGVIGVDLSFVKSLLSVVGPIYVPEYNQTVTQDNMFLLTEEHAEKDSFPGSTQKQDFLSSLLNAIQLKLQSQKTINYLGLLEQINNALVEKHLLLTVLDPSIQPGLSINGYSDSIIDTRMPSQNTISDFLSINEANLGLNKVNYFIKRKVKQQVIIDDLGKIHETITIDYKNTSDGSWPGGIYKNYLRLVTPQGATITSVEINGIKQNNIPAITDYHIYEEKNFRPPLGFEDEQTTQYGKNVIGFLVSVPVQGFTSITVSYDLAQHLSQNNSSFYYDEIVSKQAGLDSDPYNIALTFPKSFQLFSGDNAVLSGDSTLTYAYHLNKDIHLHFSFTKK
jgi:hypothetical protein